MAMMKNFPVILELSFILAFQTNSKNGEDVSQKIEPEGFVEKSDINTDIQVGKDHLK